MPYKHREDALARHKRYYDQNRDICIARTKQWQNTHPDRVCSKHKPRTKHDMNRQTAYRRTVREFIRNIKESGHCADCTKNWPAEVMDFDHVRGEKAFSISASGGYSLDAIYKEMAKCDLVCANCHRIRHILRRS